MAIDAPGLSAADTTKLGAVESIESSEFLRGTIGDELRQPTDHFDSENLQLLKFHGIHLQDNRDERAAGKAERGRQS